MTLRDAVAKKLRYWRDKYNNPKFNLYDIDEMADTICRVSSEYMITVFVMLAQGKWECNWCLNPNLGKWSKRTRNIFNIGNTDAQANVSGGGKTMPDFYAGVENYARFMRKNHYTVDGEWFLIEDVKERQLKNGHGYSYATAPGYWEKIYQNACDIREDFINYGVEDI